MEFVDMGFVVFLETAAAFFVVLAVVTLHKKRKTTIYQERLTAAFDRAQAKRTNGCVLQGNALIDPNL